MTQKKSGPGGTYHIRLKESLDRSAMDWFGEIAILPQEKDGTLLIGEFIDQPALRGFLDQLWNLNFTVLSVDRIENPEKS